MKAVTENGSHRNGTELRIPPTDFFDAELLSPTGPTEPSILQSLYLLVRPCTFEESDPLDKIHLSPRIYFSQLVSTRVVFKVTFVFTMIDGLVFSPNSCFPFRCTLKAPRDLYLFD